MPDRPRSPAPKFLKRISILQRSFQSDFFREGSSVRFLMAAAHSAGDWFKTCLVSTPQRNVTLSFINASSAFAFLADPGYVLQVDDKFAVSKALEPKHTYKNPPAGNEWLHSTDCQLFCTEKSIVVSGRWKTCFHDVSILSGNEKSNTGQSDRSNRMIPVFC